jgi:hypothetical protein
MFSNGTNEVMNDKKKLRLSRGPCNSGTIGVEPGIARRGLLVLLQSAVPYLQDRLTTAPQHSHLLGSQPSSPRSSFSMGRPHFAAASPSGEAGANAPAGIPAWRERLANESHAAAAYLQDAWRKASCTLMGFCIASRVFKLFEPFLLQTSFPFFLLSFLFRLFSQEKKDRRTSAR